MKERDTATEAAKDFYQPRQYEIRIGRYLDERWADWFDGLAITSEADGTTLLTGPVADQAALYGMLRKVRDLGLPLLAVNCIHDEQVNSPEGKR